MRRARDHWVIRENPKTGERTLDRLSWGLIPYWCADERGGRRPINAKAETAAVLPRFATPIAGAGVCCPSTTFSSGGRSKARRRSSLTPSP